MKCSICGKEIKGYGNNPFPVRLDGKCCDECNSKYVIIYRLGLLGAGATVVKEMADRLNEMSKEELDNELKDVKLG